MVNKTDKKDVFLALILLLISIYISYASYNLGLWDAFRNQPGAGLLPFITGALLFFFSLIYFVKEIMAISKNTKKDVDKIGLLGAKILIAFILPAVILFELVLDIIGFPVTMGLLSVILFGFISYEFQEKTRSLFIISVLVLLPIALHLIFRVGLNVRLPAGIFGF